MIKLQLDILCTVYRSIILHGQWYIKEILCFLTYISKTEKKNALCWKTLSMDVPWPCFRHCHTSKNLFCVKPVCLFWWFVLVSFVLMPLIHFCITQRYYSCWLTCLQIIEINVSVVRFKYIRQISQCLFWCFASRAICQKVCIEPQ